jgi:ParB family transcriptional regulator, chromosome partitioning protein
MNNKKDLKKGLSSLLKKIEQQPIDRAEQVEIVKELNSTVANIPIAKIEVNPFQPRYDFDPVELEELSSSIKIHGLIQPITVRSLGGGTFQLISGERRWRASKIAGLSDIPAYIRVANDQEMLEMALIENIQRADLNSIEVAISYQRLIDECSLTHESLSERVGKNRSTVTNYIRLLKLPPEIQTSIKKNEISMGHARVLAGVSDISQQLYLFKRTVEGDLSVRELENISKYEENEKNESKPTTNAANTTSGAVSIELDKIKKELSAKFGAKLEIIRNDKGKGKFVINFKNDKEFNSIYDVFNGLE